MLSRPLLERVLVAVGSDPVDISGLSSRFPDIAFEVVGPEAINDHIADADAAPDWLGQPTRYPRHCNSSEVDPDRRGRGRARRR